MLTRVQTWPAFSNHTVGDGGSTSNSLEGIHDGIHVDVGGNGQMSDPSVAGEYVQPFRLRNLFWSHFYHQVLILSFSCTTPTWIDCYLYGPLYILACGSAKETLKMELLPFPQMFQSIRILV